MDPDLIEGMVLLESAGRPDARASDDLEGAVGLTQILAETATSLLGMRWTSSGKRAADAEARPRARAARGRPHPRPAGARRRALRPGQVARGHRPLPEARHGRVRPRGPRRGLVPHGHRQPPAGCSAPTATTRRATRSSSSTPRPTGTRARTASSPGSATTRRPTSGACSPRAEVMRLYRDDRAELGRLAKLHGAAGRASSCCTPPPETRTREVAPDDASFAPTALAAPPLRLHPEGSSRPSPERTRRLP